MTERRQRTPGSVAVASVCAFFAVLVLLAAQLHAGRDPGLHAAARPAAIVRSAHGARVVTRASGGQVVVRSTGHSHTPITTRASGGGERDD